MEIATHEGIAEIKRQLSLVEISTTTAREYRVQRWKDIKAVCERLIKWEKSQH